MSSNAHFLAAGANNNSLQMFAHDFFIALGTNFEERESSNYLEGFYYKAQVLDLEITVSLQDQENNSDLPFWLYVRTNRELVYIENKMNDFIKNIFLPAGFQFARLYNLGKTNEIRIN